MVVRSGSMALDLPFDLATLPPPVQRLVGDKVPPPLRMMAAKGAAPGLRPEQVVLVLVLLARADFPHVEQAAREAAVATLAALPAPIRDGALASPDLAPVALDVLATTTTDREALEKLVTHPALALETVLRLARQGDEAVTELVAINEQRLLEHPTIIEALYMNKHARSSTADRVLDLAVRNGKTLNIPAFKEAAEAIVEELIVAPDAEATPDDLLFKETQSLAEALDAHDVVKEDDEGKEVLDDKAIPLEQRIRLMTISQKIRTATLGTSATRALLVRDKNRLVAQAVIRSPLLQENEAVSFAASRGVSEDVLRLIASNGELTKSHAIKFNLVSNPKTPMAQALRLLGHLRIDELRKLSKSKNVGGQIAKIAKQELEKKTPK